MENKGTYINIIKSICKKPIGIIVLNEEKPKTNSFKVRNKTKVSIVLFSTVLEFLARAERQEKEIKVI
jgi:hypothetical protein